MNARRVLGIRLIEIVCPLDPFVQRLPEHLDDVRSDHRMRSSVKLMMKPIVQCPGRRRVPRPMVAVPNLRDALGSSVVVLFVLVVPRALRRVFRALLFVPRVVTPGLPGSLRLMV
jgi:hypothetical protein